MTSPLLMYNFRVKWKDEYVAAVTHVSGLTHRTAVLSAHAGGQPQSTFKIPGQGDYAPVRLERGIVTDAAFDRWASMMWEGDLTTLRQDMQIELYDEAGLLVLRYNVYKCWPSEYTVLPELDSEANTMALASMTLQHEGWDRDTSVTPGP